MTAPDVAAAQRQFEQEERAYWRLREDLLARCPGKWVAIANEQVAGIGDTMSEAMDAAYERARSPVLFVAEVGAEDLELRVRSVASGCFDQSHRRLIPTVTATTASRDGAHSAESRFIADTGADLTLVHIEVAQQLGLRGFPVARAKVAGFGTVFQLRHLYAACVGPAGRSITVATDVRDDIDENILGRDVINEFRLIVSAKEDRVQFEAVEG